MHVVLASRFDDGAAELANSSGDSAVVLTPADLSERGWRFEPGDPARSTAIISGCPVPSAAITGVCTLLPRVMPHELPHIVEDDRAYVAAEMTAFLLSWLSSLPCPIVNRPRPGSLDGPAWSAFRWRTEALRAGFEVSEDHTAAASLTLIGGECFGATDGKHTQAALRLATAANVHVLSIEFDRHSRVISASPRPDLTFPPVAGAIRRLLEGRSR